MSRHTFSFEVNRTSAAPAELLFELYMDTDRWSDWAKPVIMRSKWEGYGDPAPGGVGAVRKVGMWPLVFREQTVEYEQNRRHVYAMVAPSRPAKDYRAEASLTPNASGGTDLRWRASFATTLPGCGPVLGVGLRAGIEMFATKIVKAAERASRSDQIR